jgi:hypothetical protein
LQALKQGGYEEIHFKDRFAHCPFDGALYSEHIFYHHSMVPAKHNEWET